MARFRYQRRLGLRARVTAAFGLGALFTAALLAATTFGISREQLIRQRESSASVPFFNNARIVQEQLRAEGDDRRAAACSRTCRPPAGPIPSSSSPTSGSPPTSASARRRCHRPCGRCVMVLPK